MTEAVKSPVSTAPAKPGKVEKAHHYLGVLSTIVGVCGGLGTLFVWFAANFYVGDLEVHTNLPVDSLIVKVYDHKGNESTFHTGKFQLMPGHYHLDIVSEGSKTAHTDVQIQYAHKTIIPVTLSSGIDDSTNEDARPVKKHWWQFWRS